MSFDLLLFKFARKFFVALCDLYILYNVFHGYNADETHVLELVVNEQGT